MRNNILKIVIFVTLSVILDYIFGIISHVSGINLSIAPFVLPAIGAGIGALSELFGGESDEEKKIKAYMKYLEQRKIDRIREAEKEKGDLARGIAGQISQRRAGAQAIANSTGQDDPNFAFTKEEDLSYAKIQGNADISKRKTDDVNAINDSIQQAQLNMPESESLFEKGFRGALGGANLGFELGDVLKLGQAGSPGGKKKTTTGLENPVSNNTTNSTDQGNMTNLSNIYDPKFLKYGVYIKRNKSYPEDKEDNQYSY